MTNDATQTAAGTTLAGTRPAKGTPNRRPTPPVRRVDASGRPSLEPSATMIVLALRPDGAKFNGNRIECAQEAGFDMLRDYPWMGYASPDTGRVIAHHQVDTSAEAFDRLQEINVYIDPVNCEFQWCAGTELMKRLVHYCVLIGAHICDGTGRRLEPGEIEAIRDHIDATMSQRDDERLAAQTVTLESGEIRLFSELSFQYTVTREAGSRKRTWRPVSFDVPAMHYYEGKAHGIELAAEISKFYKSHKQSRLNMTEILREALAPMESKYGDLDRAQRANVVAGFMSVIETMIQLGAAQLNPAWIAHHVAQSRESHERWTVDHASEKARLIERLRKGREDAKSRRAATEKKGGER